MAVVLLPLDAVGGVPAYNSQQTRQAFSALVSGATAARPLGGRSGVRPGTPDSTVSLSGANATTWNVAAHSGILDTEIPVAAAPYYYATDGADTGALTPANANNPRIDVIWITPNDNAQDGSGSLGGVIGYSAGVAASTPSAPTPGGGVPAVPARAMILAQINVPKATTGNPTVSFVAPYTAAAGGVLRARNQAERDASNPSDGSAVYRMDTNNIEVNNGASWDMFGPSALLGRATRITNSAAVSAEASLSIYVQFTLTAQRRVRVNFDGWLIGAGGATDARLTLRRNSTTGAPTIAATDIRVSIAGTGSSSGTCGRIVSEVLPAGTYTYGLLIGTIGGGTAMLQAGPDFPATLEVYDIGSS